MTKAQTSTSTSASNPAEPQEARPTMLHHTVTNWRTESHAAYLEPRAVGAASVALSGLQTILALLIQQEADKGCDGPGLLVLKPFTVEGLICAAESCAEMVGAVIDGHHDAAHSFCHDTLGQRYMSQEALRVSRGDEFKATSAAGGGK
jgi:hypothetical protein